MNKLKIYLSIFFLFLLGTINAQKENAKADKLVSRMIDNNEHALSVLVAKGDEIVYQKTIGYANAEKKIMADNTTIFRIGSVSKQFYASAILKLVEEGKINLDDPLTKYIKDFPRGDEVTIHHLLTHTSGIKSYTDEPEFIDNVADPIEIEKLMTKIKTLGYDFDPGASWKYNNSAYAIIGYIVAQVSGMTADEFLAKNVFNPADMKRSGIYYNDKKYENEALGYSNATGTVQRSLDWDMTWAGGAGNLYSTAEDLLKWNRQLFGAKFINEASIAKAHAKVKLNDGSDYPYGYGWGFGDYKQLDMIAHSGGLHGFLTNLAYYPTIDATIVVLSNCSAPKNVVPGDLTNKLADIFLKEYLKENQEIAVNTKEYDKYAGKYVYPGGAIMTITSKNDKLMAQLPGQQKFQIYPKAEHVFFWKVVDAEITFHLDENGNVEYGMHKQNGFTSKVPRQAEKVAITLSAKAFEAFSGDYSMGPSTVKVWAEGTIFYAQITGQPKFEIHPSSANRFFLKEVEAEIEFDNSKNPSPGFTLFQAGREIKGVRK